MRHRVRTAPLSFLIGLLALFLALAWLGLSYQFPHSEEESVSFANATSPVSVRNGDVQVRSWASREAVRSGDSFEVWILVQNGPVHSLTDLKITRFHSPGFVPVGTCWRSGVPGCHPGAPTATQPAGLDTSLPPEGVSMAFAELKSAGSRTADVQDIQVVLAWKVQGREQVQSLSIRPVKVVPRAPHWAVVGYSILKDLGLPLLVGILAYFFQRVLQERSRDQAARQALLTTATSNAVKYLLPAYAAIRALERTNREVLAEPDEKRKEAKRLEGFFYFAFTFKRMRDLVTSGGGFFLDNIEGERLANACWGAVLRLARRDFGAVDLSHVLDLMEGHDTLSQFLDQLSGSSTKPSAAQLAARRVRVKFGLWLEPVDQNVVLRILLVMAWVLYYEANRLFLGWYDKVASPDGPRTQEWSQAVRAFKNAHPDYSQELEPALRAYLKAWPLHLRILWWWQA